MGYLIYGKLGNKIFRRAHTRKGLKSVCYKKFIPFNPRTEKQQANRRIFSRGMKAWESLPEQEKERYRGAVEELPLLDQSLFLKFFLEKQIKDKSFFLSPTWAKELGEMALNWATERRLELELDPGPGRISKKSEKN